MSYFTNFPTIQYDINKDGTLVDLVDITRGASIRADLKANITFYIRYAYSDTDRPEIISYKIYDDPALHWLVMQMNDVVDPFYDMSVSERSLRTFVDGKYPGQTFFMNNIMTWSVESSMWVSESPQWLGNTSITSGTSGYTTIPGSYQTDEYVYAPYNVEFSGTVTGASLDYVKLPSSASSTDRAYNGSVIAFTGGTGSGQTAIITGYDATTRRATFSTSLTSHLGCDTTFEIYPTGIVHRWDATFSRVEVKDIYGTFDQLDVVRGYTSGTDSTLQRKVVYSREAVHHFENTSTGVWLDPRSGTIDYVSGYIMDTSSGVIEAAVVTNESYERELNDNKRFMSLMDKDIIGIAIANFQEEIQ